METAKDWWCAPKVCHSEFIEKWPNLQRKDTMVAYILAMAET